MDIITLISIDSVALSFVCCLLVGCATTMDEDSPKHQDTSVDVRNILFDLDKFHESLHERLQKTITKGKSTEGVVVVHYSGMMGIETSLGLRRGYHSGRWSINILSSVKRRRPIEDLDNHVFSIKLVPKSAAHVVVMTGDLRLPFQILNADGQPEKDLYVDEFQKMAIELVKGVE